MKTQLAICILGIIIAVCGAKKDQYETCDTIFCAMGQECVVRLGVPKCECIEKCFDPVSPVCGSKGTTTKTYDNLCELYKHACELKDIGGIELIARTTCEEDEMKRKEQSEEIEKDSSKEKPVVCQQKDRDLMRHAIIEWMDENLQGDHRSYEGILFSYFSKYDMNKDNMLDTTEFMKITESESALSEVLSVERGINPLLKGLCMTELVAISDYDSDYKLTFSEFFKCFDPSFEPPKESCTLEGRTFDDGDDLEQGCNTCKCACGNWVCTHKDCEKENSAKERLMAAQNLESDVNEN